MNQNQGRRKTVFKVLSIIFTIIAFLLFVLCASLAIEFFENNELNNNPETSNLGTGLSAGFALVLYIIFGAIDLPFLALGITFSALAHKRKSKLGKIFLIVNIAMTTLLIVFFAIMYSISQ